MCSQSECRRFDHGFSAGIGQAMWAGRCGHMTNLIHVLNMRYMYNIDRGEGGGKNRSLGNYQK